jgi:hypothetical protein
LVGLPITINDESRSEPCDDLNASFLSAVRQLG